MIKSIDYSKYASVDPSTSLSVEVECLKSEIKLLKNKLQEKNNEILQLKKMLHEKTVLVDQFQCLKSKRIRAKKPLSTLKRSAYFNRINQVISLISEKG